MKPLLLSHWATFEYVSYGAKSYSRSLSYLKLTVDGAGRKSICQGRRQSFILCLMFMSKKKGQIYKSLANEEMPRRTDRGRWGAHFILTNFNRLLAFIAHFRRPLKLHICLYAKSLPKMST